MRKNLIASALIAGTVAVVTLPLPASAATCAAGIGCTTPVTIQINGGGLEINVPTASVPLLPDRVASTGNQTVSANLGDVTVTDGRAGTAGWVASAHADDFTGGTSTTITVSTVDQSSYTTPAATITGSATVAPSNLNPLYPGGAVQTATGVSGINTATWDPTISVTIPGGTLAGSYSSTVTHSVI
jgi:hypothetical protein